jgi:Na+-driven multidrug efflux pump
VCGQFVAAGVGLFLNLKHNPEVHISLREIRFHKRIAADIYRIGIPSIFMQAIGSVMTFCMNKILISFTEAATAVFGAYFKLQSFIFMPVFGLNNGIIPITAYNFGAARMDRVKQATKLGVLTAVSIMIVGLVLFEAAPRMLLGLFSPSEEMLEIGVVALRVIAIHFPVAGFCIVAGSVCQALGKPEYSLINSVCRQLVVLLPAAWLLAQTGNLTLVWFSFPIAEVASMILSTIFLRKTMHHAENAIAARSH